MRHLRNLTEMASCIPFRDSAHASWRMIGCRLVVQFAVKGMAVGGISDDDTAVGCSLFSGYQARACERSGSAGYKRDSQKINTYVHLGKNFRQ